MPNKNYVRGRKFEWDRVAHYNKTMKAELACRTAGSHSKFDVIVILKGHPTFIQCKVTEDAKEMERKLKKFRESPPLPPSSKFHQCLEVKVVGSTEVHSATV